MCELKRHIFANTVDRITIKRFVQRVFPACTCKTTQQNHVTPSPDVNKDGGTVLRACLGHERSLPIEATVQSLDIKEEGKITQIF